MGIQYQWDDPEKTILRYHFEPNWTWKDLHDLVSHTNAEIDLLDHNVDIVVIYDAPTDIKLPAGFFANVINIARLKRHPRANPIIIIARSAYLQGLLGVTLKVAQSVNLDFIKVVHSESEAMTLVESLQSSQP